MHIEVTGSGTPLLLIHGWGMHSGMWGQVAKKLAQSYKVYSVDLPGHGLSKVTVLNSANGVESLDAIVAQLTAQFTEPINLCGWSLGGQIALRWAQLHPAQVNKLVLVASTPCFVQTSNWPAAMATKTLQGFADALIQNPTQTLRRFLALQVRGSENEKEILGDLRAQLFAKGEPDVDALKNGLEILRTIDLRAALQNITQATLVIAGERDTLTPQAAAEYMAQSLPNARLEMIKGAAHAPFLSHPHVFMQHLTRFLDE